MSSTHDFGDDVRLPKFKFALRPVDATRIGTLEDILGKAKLSALAYR